jgi:MFS family permease
MVSDSGSASGKFPWINRTVIGIGLASLFSDWAHEAATTILPAFLATIGAAAAWLGLIEGFADGLASFAKMASGFYTDKLQRRKPIAVIGYVITAVGTASFCLTTSAWQVLAGRSLAWLGRGVRTPVRKALLAAAVTKETYGRAFGFERMMDTVGAIAGPATALLLLAVFAHDYRRVFLATLIPGLLAAALIAFLVKEKERKRVSHISLTERLRSLPPPYRKFLVGVGFFGAGDFAPTLLILLATQKLTPQFGAARAASIAVGFYLLRNTLNAACAPLAGWLADRFAKKLVLAAGYSLAAVMALLIVLAPMNVWTLAVVFALAGIFIAIAETLEDSFCAELVGEDHHGTAFGVLATVNGIGDFLSSTVVGVLWSAFGTGTAFSYSAALFLVGAILVLRTNKDVSTLKG